VAAKAPFRKKFRTQENNQTIGKPLEFWVDVTKFESKNT
jgi:hypothetical protein